MKSVLQEFTSQSVFTQNLVYNMNSKVPNLNKNQQVLDVKASRPTNDRTEESKEINDTEEGQIQYLSKQGEGKIYYYHLKFYKNDRVDLYTLCLLLYCTCGDLWKLAGIN